MDQDFTVVQTDDAGKELIAHGTPLFPLHNVFDDFSILDTVAWHWHVEFEMGIVLKGKLQLAVHTEKYDLDQGDGFFINSEVLHAAFDSNHTGCILRSIVFHPRLIGGSVDSIFYQGYVIPLMKNNGFKGMIFRGNQKRHVRQLENLRRAVSLCDEKPIGYELSVRSDLSEIILYLFEIQCDVQEKGSEADRRNEWRLRKILELIENRYADPLKLQELADEAYVSKTECIRCFKSITGRSPMQYLKEYRLQKSVELLLSTNWSIGRIGEACGFSEINYFTRSFRKRYALTPSEYRRKHLNTFQVEND
ncbi:MAG: helix-turn-helix domain-containing protein [Candidatus Onthomonas sp.]